VELADLTRDIRKNIFLEPDFFFAKPGCLSFTRAVPKKSEKNIFLEPEKMISQLQPRLNPSPLQPGQRERIRRQNALKARVL